MVPFRVFDRKEKQMWQVVNYHPGTNSAGSYLATKEDDSETDGDMSIIPAEEISTFKFVDFLEEVDSYSE